MILKIPTFLMVFSGLDGLEDVQTSSVALVWGISSSIASPSPRAINLLTTRLQAPGGMCNSFSM
jgi:hypothetical protein